MQILQIDDNADDTRSYSINTRALALPQAARLPRHHEADAVLSRFGIVGLVVTYINKTNTRLIVNQNSGARHPVFCDATNEKIPADKLVTCELPFVALKGADVTTPYTNTGIISPARETGISCCRIPLETTF
jgi:hypothetical protein